MHQATGEGEEELDKKGFYSLFAELQAVDFCAWVYPTGTAGRRIPKRVVFCASSERCHILMRLITEMNTNKCRSQLLNFIKKPLSNLPSFCYVAVSTPFFVFPIEAVSTIVSTIIFTMPRFMAGEFRRTCRALSRSRPFGCSTPMAPGSCTSGGRYLQKL